MLRFPLQFLSFRTSSPFRTLSSRAAGTLRIINPATEQVVKELPKDDELIIRDKITRAREAQKKWSQTSLSQRLEIIKKFGDALVGPRVDELAAALTSEMGKPLKHAKGEIRTTAGRVEYFLQNVEKVLRETKLPSRGGVEEHITWEPLGLIANISPWNYPYFVTSNIIIPALLTGNGVIFKPSEHATLSGLLMADLLHQSGVPKDLLSVVIGDGETGAKLLKEDGLNGVFFTGSVPTGRKIGAAAAEKLIKYQAELGGKDAVYVAPDAHVQHSAESLADGVCWNAGQGCCSVERIYVAQEIYEPFLEELVKTTKTFKIGDPLHDETYIGPLTRKEQVKVLSEQVRDAKEKGARILLGGQSWNDSPNGKGYFFLPTIVADVRKDMIIHSQESFGPIVAVSPVKNEEEAIQKMNDSEFGLTAGVYSSNRETAERVLSRVDAGTVYWNCCDRVSPQLPWSGRKESGLGISLSLEGIRSFVVPKAWHLNPKN
eukprot:TRINITY_DN12603_c0_g1_i1.p1 TRINITY_DN12603_c0_g1~~TRINITY_DN12603_c0_g1_i1.p1  ORF type:complete len:489 (+),score=118.36 TRINITY_DN12603_c0_g1_i1:21-1487(+)